MTARMDYLEVLHLFLKLFIEVHVFYVTDNWPFTIISLFQL